MPALLIGTQSAVYRLERGGPAPEQPGPEAVAFLAAAGPAAYALEPGGALWFRSPEGAWSRVAPRTVEDEVWSFAADPRLPGRLYLGVSPALLYRSDDGGRSWTPCDSVRRIPGYERWTFPPPPHLPHVRSVVPDPRTPGAVYIGAEEGGVYRSPDGGETWESLNEGLYWDVHAVAVTPDGGTLYATTGSGFHRGEDAGARWQRSMEGMDRTYTVALAVDPDRPSRVYVAAAAGPPPAWRNGANAALYRSDDAGRSWRRLAAGLPERFDAMVSALAAAPGGRLYAAAGTELFASGDGGEAWSRLARDLPPVRALALV